MIALVETLKNALEEEKTPDMTVEKALGLTPQKVTAAFVSFIVGIDNLPKAATEPLSPVDFELLQATCIEFNTIIKSYDLLSAFTAAHVMTRLVNNATIQQLSPAERAAYDAAELEMAKLREAMS